MKYKMNPVWRKDLRVSVRTFKFALLVTLYNLALSAVALFMFYTYFDSNYHSYYMQYEYSNILQVYLAIAIIEYALTIFIVPVQTASSIAGERERQTLEILLTTSLKPWQIVVGKLESSLGYILLLVVSSLPTISIVFSIGGVTVRAVVGLVVMIFSSAIYAGSIGVWTSSRLKKTIPSIVTTFCIMFIIGVGTVILPLVIMLIYEGRQNAGYAAPDGIGAWAWLFIINPAFSLISLFSQEFGEADFLREFIVNDLQGSIPESVIEHWFAISLSVQFAISMLFMYMATKALDPLRKRRMKRKEKREWKQLQAELAKKAGNGEI